MKYRQIERHIAQMGVPQYRYTQVLHAIFKQRIGSFSRMTALPIELRGA